MEVTHKKVDNLKREMHITLPAKDVQKEIDEKLKGLSQTIKMAGFRPGKVPLDLVKKKHGAAVTGEVLEQVINQTSQEALEKEELRPAMQPKIEIVDFAEGTDLKYKMEFEIYPEVPKMDFKDIVLEKLVADINDEEVDKALKELAKSAVHYHKADRAAKDGDAIIIDFKGLLDGEVFEGGEALNHTLVLGSNSFIPGFEEQLLKSKAGDEKKVNVTFPEQYHSTELAGKEVVFEVTVHEVQESKKHEVNDELAGHFNMETLDELKEAIKKQITTECETLCRTQIKKQLFDLMDEQYKFDVPEEMKEMEFEAIWQQVNQAREQDPDAEDFKKPDEELRKEFQEMAERRVRLGIILAELGKENDIVVDNNELTQAITKRASQFPGQEEKIFDYYKKNPHTLEELRGPILEEKVVDFILEKVELKEKKVSIDEMKKFDEE